VLFCVLHHAYIHAERRCSGRGRRDANDYTSNVQSTRIHFHNLLILFLKQRAVLRPAPRLYPCGAPLQRPWTADANGTCQRWPKGAPAGPLPSPSSSVLIPLLTRSHAAVAAAPSRRFSRRVPRQKATVKSEKNSSLIGLNSSNASGSRS
jgi:hypothetical protein